jgi:hypothetical protein
MRRVRIEGNKELKELPLALPGDSLTGDSETPSLLSEEPRAPAFDETAQNKRTLRARKKKPAKRR